jgi:dinuclear metal center YbgI/SA1388 family protein
MITIQDLFLFCQNLLSPEEFSDYCPNGIQVEGKPQVKRICFAVSASLAVIDEALKRGADVLIVHHGIFWNKDPYPIVGTKREKLERLLKSGMTLLAYHLPLDAHPHVGNNWKAAQDLGLTDCKPFCDVGVQGRMPPISTEAFGSKLQAYYGHTAHVALGGKQEVSTVAIISGGAHRNIEQAASAGIDCYVTGSFDEPIWDIAHERKINFFALGHYSTERVGILALMGEIKNQFKIPCEFIDLFNPF